MADAWHLLHNLAGASSASSDDTAPNCVNPLTVRTDQDDTCLPADTVPTVLGELDVHGDVRGP
ncbi:hypothetical protein ACFWD7_46570 [Streptomyces mirabilis]|uniref:hypothetical protein n=1 Tax=Streptomyces mirabilis TaxID=68239 RepID=UPI00367BDC11